MSIREIITSRCVTDPITGCWNWTRARNAHGYGVVWFEGKLHRAHRLAFVALVGPLAPQECALHRCDNPACCNPSHLFRGSKADNSADMVRKGRSPAGERHGQAKLTRSDVETIRKLAATGRLTTDQIGARFGVRGNTVSRIVNGLRWGAAS